MDECAHFFFLHRNRFLWSHARRRTTIQWIPSNEYTSSNEFVRTILFLKNVMQGFVIWMYSVHYDVSRVDSATLHVIIRWSKTEQCHSSLLLSLLVRSCLFSLISIHISNLFEPVERSVCTPNQGIIAVDFCVLCVCSVLPLRLLLRHHLILGWQTHDCTMCTYSVHVAHTMSQYSFDHLDAFMAETEREEKTGSSRRRQTDRRSECLFAMTTAAVAMAAAAAAVASNQCRLGSALLAHFEFRATAYKCRTKKKQRTATANPSRDCDRLVNWAIHTHTRAYARNRRNAKSCGTHEPAECAAVIST